MRFKVFIPPSLKCSQTIVIKTSHSSRVASVEDLHSWETRKINVRIKYIAHIISECCNGTNYNKKNLAVSFIPRALINGMNYCMQWCIAKNRARKRRNKKGDPLRRRGYLNRRTTLVVVSTVGNNFDFFLFCRSRNAESFVWNIKKPWILYSWCVLLLNEGSNSLPSLRMVDCHGRPFNCLEAACKCKLHFDFFWAIWNFLCYLWRLCLAFEIPNSIAVPFSIHAQFFLHCTYPHHHHHFIFTCCCPMMMMKIAAQILLKFYFTKIFS